MNSIFPAGHVFPPTHWTLIAATDGPRREAALAELYRIYWRPLCAQARRIGLDENAVEDAVQDFLVRLFGDDSLQRANPAAGRFRSYLVGALRHSLWQRLARERALKRGGGAAPVSLAATEEMEAVGSRPDETREFDVEWARALLAHAVSRFHTEVQGGPEAHESMTLLVPWVFGEETLSHAETGQRLGITVAAVKSRIFRLRERFRRIVREEVLRTVTNEAECEDELRYLCAVLDQTEGGGDASARAAA